DDAGEVDGDSWNGREPFGETPGVGVILDESLAVIIKGVQRGGREDAGLPHRAAEHLAEAAHARDGGFVTGHGRAGGGPQTLGKTAADGVEVPGVVRGLQPGGRAGVPDTGAVEVEPEAVFPGDGRDTLNLLDRPDGAAATVVGVLDNHERGLRKMDRAGTND